MIGMTRRAQADAGPPSRHGGRPDAGGGGAAAARRGGAGGARPGQAPRPVGRSRACSRGRLHPAHAAQARRAAPAGCGPARPGGAAGPSAGQQRRPRPRGRSRTPACRAGRCSPGCGRASNALDAPVLQRVEGDDDQAAAGGEAGPRPRPGPASRLPSSSFTAIRSAWKTRLAGWPPAKRAGVGMADVRTTSTRSPVRRSAPRAAPDDCAGDLPGVALLAVLRQHLGELALVPLVDHLGGGQLGARDPCACRAAPRRSTRSRARAGRPASTTGPGPSGPRRRAGRWPARRSASAKLPRMKRVRAVAQAANRRSGASPPGRGRSRRSVPSGPRAAPARRRGRRRRRCSRPRSRPGRSSSSCDTSAASTGTCAMAELLL